MRETHFVRCAASLALLAVSFSSSAHHAVHLFDTTVPIRVKGTVVEFNWGYPHTAIIIEEIAGDGTRVRWALENSTRPDLLEHMGYTRDSFKAGDQIEACGFEPRQPYPSRLSSPATDGRTVFAPQWLEGAERVITARLLLTKDGPETHYSHYGPLELCTDDEDMIALAADHSAHRGSGPR